MKYPIVLASALTISLAACGGAEGETGSSTKAANDALTITLTGAETSSTASGIVNTCEISYTAKNRLKHEAKYVGLEFETVLSDDAAITSSYTANIDGPQRLYVGKIGKGKSVDDSVGARGVACEDLSAIKIVAVTCGAPDGGGSCADKVTVNGNGVLDIQQ